MSCRRVVQVCLGAALVTTIGCTGGAGDVGAAGQRLESEPSSDYSGIEGPLLDGERRRIVRGAAGYPTELQGTELIANGGFETGSLDGWGAVVVGSGAWVIFDEFFEPASGIPAEAPFEGEFGAITEMTGPGSRFLFQDVSLGQGQATLQFADKLDNLAGVFVTDSQEYRVDIVEPGEPGQETVLATLFRTQPGDPPQTPFTRREFDVSEFADQTVRVRFTQIDSLFFFNAKVDAVSLVQEQGVETACDVGISGSPNPLPPDDPFVLDMDFANTADAFDGSFAVFVIAGGAVLPIKEETATLNERFAVGGFPIFATLSQPALAPSIGFLITVTDVSSGALVCSDVTVVSFSNQIQSAERADIERVAARYILGLRRGRVD